MRDYLIDLVAHTHKLGNIEVIKVVGTDDETTINAYAEDRSVILMGRFKQPLKEFKGTFGIPNLGILSTLLSIDAYADGAKITMAFKDDGTPTELRFVSQNKDFKNNFRFLSEKLITTKVQTLEFREPPYELDIEPDMISVQKLKWQSQAVPDETLFTARVKDGELLLSFGGVGETGGEFVFADAKGSKLTKAWSYPISQTLAILALDGDKRMKFSNQAALVITVDSGLIEYTYVLPGQSK